MVPLAAETAGLNSAAPLVAPHRRQERQQHGKQRLHQFRHTAHRAVRLRQVNAQIGGQHRSQRQKTGVFRHFGHPAAAFQSAYQGAEERRADQAQQTAQAGQHLPQRQIAQHVGGGRRVPYRFTPGQAQQQIADARLAGGLLQRRNIHHLHRLTEAVFDTVCVPDHREEKQQGQQGPRPRFHAVSSRISLAICRSSGADSATSASLAESSTRKAMPSSPASRQA